MELAMTVFGRKRATYSDLEHRSGWWTEENGRAQAHEKDEEAYFLYGDEERRGDAQRIGRAGCALATRGYPTGTNPFGALKAVPDDKIAELIDGELFVSPRPAGPHTKAASFIFGDLFGDFGDERGRRGRPGGWWILFEPELHFGANVLVPDLAGWRRERWADVPNVQFFTDAPDWICQVASSSTARFDRERKMPIYAAAGVRHAWLVEPLERRVDVFRLEDGAWSLARSCSNVEFLRAEPFEAAELETARWWLERVRRLVSPLTRGD